MEDLQSLPTLASRKAKPVHTWNVRPGVDPALLDEFSRITESCTLNYQNEKPEHVEDAVARCRRTGAKICLMISPRVPAMKVVLEDPETYVAECDELVAVLAKIKERVAGRAEFVVVGIDLERWTYKYDPRSDEDLRRNEIVRAYNVFLYRTIKAIIGDVPVHRYGHGHVGESASRLHGGWHASSYATYADPVDGGFSLSWYRPLYYRDQIHELTKVVERAKLHGVCRGDVWLALGATSVTSKSWLPPGHGYPCVGGNVYAVPYSTYMSYRYGSTLNHPWYDAVIEGESQHQGRFPAVHKVKTIFLWPCVFHPSVPEYGEHLVAFLRGCMRLEHVWTTAGEQPEEVPCPPAQR